MTAREALIIFIVMVVVFVCVRVENALQTRPKSTHDRMRRDLEIDDR